MRIESYFLALGFDMLNQQSDTINSGQKRKDKKTDMKFRITRHVQPTCLLFQN